MAFENIGSWGKSNLELICHLSSYGGVLFLNQLTVYLQLFVTIQSELLINLITISAGVFE